MAQKRSKGGLGKGLGALIKNTSESEDRDSSTGKTQNTEDQALQESNQVVAERYSTGTNSKAGIRPSDNFFTGGSFDSPNHGKKTRKPVPNVFVSRETSTSEEESEEAQVNLLRLPLDSIQPNKWQPREYFDEEDMDELVSSVSEVGVLQPIVVRPTGNTDSYEIIMGERRWRASKRAGLETIPAIIRETEDDEMLREALLENIHRSELNPLEEAAAYEQLMTDFGWSQEILSKRIGRSRPHISNTLRLTKLPSFVQPKVASGVLSAGHARALLGLNEQSLMREVSDRVTNEGLSVRATEELVALYNSGARRVTTPNRISRDTRFDELASIFGDELDTQVKISLGARKGKISIDFASSDDLQRILDLIQPSRRD